MKTALITGGGARLGRYIAQGLSDEGWDIIIHYNRSQQSSEDLVRSLKTSGALAAAVQANLNIPQDCNALIKKAQDAIGHPITALINNASTFNPDRLDNFNNSQLEHHLNINLKAPLKLAQDFAMNLPPDIQGNIINILDQRILKPNPLYFTYSLSKSALYWATKTMAQSFAPHIRVNAIGPGPTLKNIHQTDEDFDNESQHTLLGYGSQPASILDGVKYLLSASSVTGQMIAIDSGQHLNWQTQDLM